MKILVTGGTGFLGQAVIRELAQHGHRVRSLSRNLPKNAAASAADAVRDVEFFRGDISDADAVRRACAGMDAVIHTAAKAGVWGSAEEFRRINFGGTQNVVAACRAAGVSFLVHTSTPSVTYSGAALSGVDESAPLVRRCPSAYPTTKAEAEKFALAADCASLRVVALRPHLIWGVGDPHLVPRLIHRAQRGRLRIVGNGENRVDLTHVRNAALAHRLALEALIAPPQNAVSGRAYFISDGVPVLLWEWINELLERLRIAPVERRVSHGLARFLGAACEALWTIFPLSGEPPMSRFVADELAHDHWFDISAARRELAYVPTIGGSADMDALVEWAERELLSPSASAITRGAA